MAFTLANEWEYEAKQTRRVLERVPEQKLAWKPHTKSTTLGGLAQHIANIPSWADGVITKPEYIMTGERLSEPTTRQEILDRFDRESARMLELLKELDMDTMEDSWSLKAGNHTVLTQPRAATIRTFLFSHLIHHRAQLTVYLRLLDVPVPGLYGPSADE